MNIINIATKIIAKNVIGMTKAWLKIENFYGNLIEEKLSLSNINFLKQRFALKYYSYDQIKY